MSVADELDRRDLHRGALTNLVGAGLKLADPVLLVAVAASYGPARFGLFYVAQAVVLLLLRVSLVGFDKAVLWWVPRERDRRPTPLLQRLVRPALCVAAVVVALVFAFADHAPEVAATLRVMALSLPLLVVTELLTHATMGLRRMGVNIIVKDAVIPLAFPAFGLAFVALGRLEDGLGWAYLGSNAVGAVAAWVGYRVAFRDRADGAADPPGLFAYALPMWAAEVSNSMLQRVDVLLVEALTRDFALAGVWAVVLKLANALRAIRRSFDPIVAAIAAEPAVSGARLRAVMTRASLMVSAVQVPVVAILYVFGEPLLAAFGDGDFSGGTTPLLVLTTGWLITSTVGLTGVALYARGHGRAHLLNTVVTLAAVVVVGVFAIPRWELVGAAVAVVSGAAVQALLQTVMLQRRTGVWGVSWTGLVPIAVGAAAALPAQMVDGAAQLAVFGGLYALAVIPLIWRRG